jgi:hypothetical protein
VAAPTAQADRTNKMMMLINPTLMCFIASSSIKLVVLIL